MRLCVSSGASLRIEGAVLQGSARGAEAHPQKTSSLLSLWLMVCRILRVVEHRQ